MARVAEFANVKGHGDVGLTNHNQCYVTLISKSLHSTWMGRVVPANSQAEQRPFSRFVLAAPHDDGMNSMTTCEAVLRDSDEALIEVLARHIPALGWVAEHVSNAVIAKCLPNSLFNAERGRVSDEDSNLRPRNYSERHASHAPRHWR